MKWTALMMLAALAACGVDGAPSAPAGAASGVTIGGEARIGVVGGL